MTTNRELPIFVVSLEQSLERRAKIEAQFKKRNFDFTFFNAINGNKINAQELSSLYNEGLALKTCRRPLTLGEIGCSLSHLFLYKKMVEEGIEEAIIFEDDIVINDHFAEVYTSLKNSQDLPLENAILFLGGQEGLLDHDWWLTTSIFGVKVISENIKIKKSTKSIKYIARTCAYFISHSVAEKIYKAAMPVHIPIDHWAYFYRLKCFSDTYVVQPWVIQHPVLISSQSLIEQERAKVVEQYNSPSPKEWLRGINAPLFNSLKFLKHVGRQILRFLP